MILPRVMCAICDKPVERLEAWRELSTDVQFLKAYCHGDTDTMQIDPRKVDMSLTKIIEGAEGVAFSVKRIAGEGPHQEKGR